MRLFFPLPRFFLLKYLVFLTFFNIFAVEKVKPLEQTPSNDNNIIWFYLIKIIYKKNYGFDAFFNLKVYL